MGIFSSKRFWSALVGLVVLVVSALMPALADQLNIIAPSVVAIVGILIGGFTVEQTAAAAKSGEVKKA